MSSQTIIDGGLQYVPQLATGNQIVYLDFDGELTQYRNDDLDITLDVAVEDSGLSDEQKLYILSTLADEFSDAGWVFTIEKPKETTEYSTVFIGQTDAFKQYGEFAGLAETIDIGNQIKNDNAFVLADTQTAPDTVISVISHELEHIILGQKHEYQTGTLQDYADTRISSQTASLSVSVSRSGGQNPGTAKAETEYWTSAIPSGADYALIRITNEGVTSCDGGDSYYTDIIVEYDGNSYSIASERSRTFTISSNKTFSITRKAYLELAVDHSIDEYEYVGGSIGYKWVHIGYYYESGKVTNTVSIKADYYSHVDSTGPVITVSGNPSGWTKDAVKLSANFSDSESGVKNKQYSLDNKNWKTYSQAITIKKHSTVYFRSTDKLGNVSTKEVEVKIDTQAPTVSVSGNPTTLTKEATLTVSAQDTESGVKMTQYSTDKKTWYTYSQALTVTQNGTYYFQATDNVGNVSAVKSINVSKIYNLPDLEVKSVVVKQNVIDITQETTLNFTIQNTGNVTANVSMAYIYDSDTGKLLGKVEVDSIKAGDTSATYSFTIKGSDLSIGDHNLQVVANGNSSIKESFNDNNSQRCSLTVTEPRPDLTVKSIGFSSQTLYADEAQTLQIAIANTGSAAAKAFKADLYVNGNKIETLSFDPLTTEGVSLASIAVDSNILVQGENQIQVVLDSEKVNTENNESNNSSTISVQAQKHYVDLAVSDFSIDNLEEPYTQNDIVQVHYKVTNYGDKVSDTTIAELKWKSDDSATIIHTLKSQMIEALNPGETKEYAFSLNVREIDSGSVNLVLDSGNSIEEISKDNNETGTQWIKGNYTDYNAYCYASWLTSDVRNGNILGKSGTHFSNSAYVCMQSRPPSCDLQFYDGSRKITSIKSSDFTYDMSYSCYYAPIDLSALSAGSYNIYCYFCSTNDHSVFSVKGLEVKDCKNGTRLIVKGSSSKWNGYGGTPEVLETANISFSDITINTNNGLKNSFSASIKLTNTGGKSKSSRFISVYADGQKIGNFSRAVLAKNESVTVSFICAPGLLTAGQHTIVFYDETSLEKVQLCEKTLTIGSALPDLAVRELILSGDTVNFSQSVKVDFTVKNIGNSSTAASKVYVYDGNTKLGEVQVSALSAGASVKCSYTIGSGVLAGGNHSLKIVADGALTIAESNEDNNTLTYSLTVNPVYNEDTTLPVISKVSLSQGASNYTFTATVTASDNKTAVANLKYQIKYATTQNALSTATAQSGRDFTLKDSDAGKTMYYQVGVTDEAGNTAWSDATSFTVKDVTKPVLNGKPTAATNGLNVTVSWSAASDNVKVTGYHLTVDGKVYTVTGTSYTVNNLSVGNHTYSLSAYDAAGNETAKTADQNFTIAEPADTVKPTISKVSLSQGASNYTFTATVTASDNKTAVANLEYQIKYAATQNALSTATVQSGKSFTLAASDAGKTMYYQVGVTDEAGNTAWSDATSFTVKDIESDNWDDLKTVGPQGEIGSFGKITAQASYTDEIGKVDPVDYLAFTLDSAAKLSFTVTSGVNAKFTVNQLVAKTDKKGNVTYSLKSLQSSSLKSGKELTTKDLLLAQGTYYIGMASSDKKNASAEYSIAVGNRTSFFTKGDNSDDWTNMKQDLNADLGVIQEAGNLLSDWVGFGDAVDYREFTLETAANLAFDLSATDAVKFTIYALNSKTDKKGKTTYSLKSLQSTSLKAGKTITTKNLLLTKGTYYMAMESTTAKKGGSADYDIAVSTKSAFFTQGNNSDDWTDMKVAGPDGDVGCIYATLPGEILSDWVGYGDEFDYFKLSFGKDVAASTSFHITATDKINVTVYTLEEGKNSTYKLKKVLSQNVNGSADFKENLYYSSDDYYVCVKSLNAKTGGAASYSISCNEDILYIPYSSKSPEILADKATVVSVGEWVSGKLTAEDASKFYTVNYTSGQALFLSLDQKTRDAVAKNEIEIRFYDEDGSSICFYGENANTLELGSWERDSDVSYIELRAGENFTDETSFCFQGCSQSELANLAESALPSLAESSTMPEQDCSLTGGWEDCFSDSTATALWASTESDIGFSETGLEDKQKGVLANL